MSDYYTEFSEKLGEIGVTAKETEHAGIDLPLPVAKELYYGIICYTRADKEFSKGNDKNAFKELQKAVNHVSQASFYALKFRFLFYSEFVRSAIVVFKKHKKHILNYDEQSKNFPEIIDLIENTGLPRETSPKSQATCKDVIKKLQAFLSNFKTDEGELFPTRDTRPKTDFSGMPNNYIQLKSKLFENFDKAETRIKRLENTEFSLPVARDLYYGITSYIKADKELSQGNEEGAVNEMKEAVYRSRWAFFDAAKLSVLDYLRDACGTWALLIRHEQLADRYVSGYRKRTRDLSAIGKIIENKKFPDEEPEEKQAVSCEDKLREFLEDFQKDNWGFFKALGREEEASKRAQETKSREKEAKKRNQAARNGLWHRLWEKALTAAVNVAVPIIVVIALIYLVTYFFGEYLNQNPIFWKLIPFLKP